MAEQNPEIVQQVQEILGSPTAFPGQDVPPTYARIMKACQNLKYEDMSEGLMLRLEAIVTVLHEENLPQHAVTAFCSMIDLLRASERANANLNRNQIDIREQIAQFHRTGGNPGSSLIS